jgi:hypothetical protein
MMLTISPRLRKPAVMAVAGLLFGAAWLVRGGPLWWVSIPAVVGAAARAVSLYRLGGQDNDEGALAGSRADERQKLLSQRSRTLGFNLVVSTAFVGLTAAIAVKSDWAGPFLVILAVAGFGYLLGLSNYGVAEEETAGDEGAGQPARPSFR